MTLDELLTLDTSTLLSELQTEPEITRTEVKNREYYEGNHPILTDPKRADYTYNPPKRDANGDIIKGSDGKPQQGEPITVTRARIVMSYPKQIVTTKTAMIAGNGIDLINQSEENDSDQFSIFKDIFYRKIKMPSVMSEVIRTTAIETHCAVIFFFKNADVKQGVKAKILSKQNGDTIYPYFDSDGDLIAFTRVFTDKIVDNGAVTEVEVLQAYFADKMIEQIGDNEPEEKPNPYGKIPIVYFDQVYPEFKDAKNLINNQEYTASQQYEVNRRIANPAVVVEGEVSSMPDPAADTKMFKVKSVEGIDGKKQFGKVSLLESKSAPENIKLQQETTDKNIERASWVDLSKLRDMVSGAVSGYAMEIALTDAFAKRAEQLPIFADGMTRCISILKTMLSSSRVEGEQGDFETLKIDHKFKALLPDDIVTITSVLAEASQSGVTSQQNAVRIYPLNNNPEQIIEELNEVQGGTAN